MGKNVLIIGNGFDLAHGLPTSYVDFLEFAYRFRIITTYEKSDYEERHLLDEKINKYVRDKLSECFRNREQNPSRYGANEINEPYCFGTTEMNHLYSNLRTNIWFDYFWNLYKTPNTLRGRNWIDFEREISEIVMWMEENCDDISMPFLVLVQMMNNTDKSSGKIKMFYDSISRNLEQSTVTIEKFINIIYDDLERLTCALEGYLSYFVDNREVVQNSYIKDIKPDYVISFNYTDTFERLYVRENDKQSQVCYIHGKCRDIVDTNDTNIVLGIDETLDESDRNIKTDFAIFKKFVQRIRKKNDTTYRRFLAEAESTYSRHKMLSEGKNKNSYINGCSDVYVFGHSLDITDKDVLVDILKSECTALHIYTYGKVNEGKLISNMIKIVEEDVLIEKNNTDRIEFIVMDES